MVTPCSERGTFRSPVGEGARGGRLEGDGRRSVEGDGGGSVRATVVGECEGDGGGQG